MAKVVELTKSDNDLQFSVNAKAFREAFQIVSLTLDKRRDSEGSNLYLEAVTKGEPRLLLFTTNHQQMCLIKIPATVEKTGSVVLDPHLLVKILAGLDEEAVMSFARKTGSVRVQMKAGNSRVNFTVGKEGMFPQLIRSLPYTKKEDVRLEAFKLREVIDRASAFFYKDDDNYSLQNILIEVKNKYLEAYATNRVSVAHAGIEAADEGLEFGVQIPGVAVVSLRRILARVKDTETEKLTLRLMLKRDETGLPVNLCVRTNDLFYLTSLTSAAMPASIRTADSGLIATNEVSISRENLLGVLSRASAFCANSKCIRVTAEASQIRIQASNLDAQSSDFEEEVALASEFASAEQIHISIDSLRDALNSAKEEFVKITFSQQKTVILVTSGNDQAGRSSYLLSTMRAA